MREKVEVVSGGGWGVWVRGNDYLDRGIGYGGEEDVIMSSFGDMLKVGGR